MSTKKSPESQIDSKRIFSEEKAKREIAKLFFEIILEKYAEYVTEGNNGIIFKFDINKLSPEDAQMMVENNIIENTSIAIKLLKVYRPGLAVKEFEMQQQAQQILNEKSSNDKEYAEVPRVYKTSEVDIPQALQKMLKSKGTHIGEKGEILVMDFIEGTDLATLMYQSVVKTHPTTSHLANIATQLSLDDLQAQVASALQYEMAVIKGNAAEQQERERRIQGRNGEKLHQHLRRINFILPQDVLDKVANTIRLWNKNNLFHNDLHERNVMLARDGKVYIIDFGASHSDPLNRGSHLPDDGILHSLKKLVATNESEMQEKKDKVIEDLNRIKKQIKNMPETISILKKISEDHLKMSQVVKASDFSRMVNDFNAQKFFALCLIIIEENLLTKEEIRSELELLRKTTKSEMQEGLIKKYMVAL